MVHLLFGPEVRLMLREDDAFGMQAFCETLHPATIAETLSDEFKVDEVWRFLQHTDVRTQAAIFEYFPIEWQVELVEGTGRQHMARLLEQMSSDDRADVLRRLTPRVAENLLRLVDEADRRDMALLVSQEADTAGGLMTTDYAWVPADISGGVAIERLRLQAPNTETIYYIYVLNSERKLLGVVSLRDLILSPPQTVVRDMMDAEPLFVRVHDDREHVANELARYDLIAIPVIDNQNRLVGIVTHDDIIDVVVEEATEDVYRMGAVGPMEETYLNANFFAVWRSRVFWLACLFLGGILTCMAMAGLQRSIEAIVALNLFIPLCISTGGNAGSQAVTLITRALALGHITAREWWNVLRHELMMGVALGMTLGLVGFVIGLLTPSRLLENPDGSVIPSWLLGLVIGQAVIGICMWGTLVGSMLPLFFQRIGVDPGIASNPFVATLADVVGIIIYFSIANAYLLS
ncbi:MAG: magnesium transporter [Gemmataceae bacterium]